jgi:hypothetical protein
VSEPTLTPLAYVTLRFFAEGLEPVEIAERTGQPWATVKAILSSQADGQRSYAKALIAEHPPIDEAEIMAALKRSRDAAAEQALPKPVAVQLPEPDLSDLESAERLLDAGRDATEPTVKAAFQTAAEGLAGLLRAVKHARQRSLVAEELAVLDTKAKALRDWLEAA